MIIIIDNFDSFTHNIFQYVREFSEEPCSVFRNNQLSVDEVLALNPSLIILSPGPGRPEDGGISLKLVKRVAGKIPLFGVCLGHQIIAAAFGASITLAETVMHGKTDTISVDRSGLFCNSPKTFSVMRYHSLLVDESTLSSEFIISARSSSNEIMGIRHKQSDQDGFAFIEGVQFHPESIATEEGKRMIANLFDYRRESFRSERLLGTLMEKKEPNTEDVRRFIEDLTKGIVQPTLAAAIIGAFGQMPSAATIAAAATILRKKAPRIYSDTPILDTCGTGGDGAHTFNISSLVALLCSACGAKVAKHGNRAVSSSSGSADLYESLSIPIDLSVENATRCLAETGFCFLFAPRYHGGLRFAGPIRAAMGVKTIFNILGPLCSPAQAEHQLIGVYDDALRPIVAKAALLLGVKRVLVVHSGIDEISVSRPTKASLGENESIKELTIDPRDMGISFYDDSALVAETAQDITEQPRLFLNGDECNPALRDAVLINTAAALFVGELCPSISEGFSLARRTYEQNKQSKLLQTLQTWS